jgi:hypothetical protein
MYEVIDTIHYTRAWLRHHADKSQTEGLMAIIGPVQARTPFPAGTHVRVSKPDGSSVELRVADVQINPGGVVGLFFADVELVIPRGSFIQQLD